MQITAKGKTKAARKRIIANKGRNRLKKKGVKETSASQGRLERKLLTKKGNTEKMEGGGGGKGKREGTPIYLPFAFSVAE